MKIAKLPSCFRPKRNDNLIRIGKKNDGGYVIDRSIVKKTDCLISLGINDDWSFEEDFLDLNNVPLYAFDASISRQFFKRKLYKSIRNFNLKQLKRSVRTLNAYKRFFDNVNRTHIEKFVGFDDEAMFISLNSIVSKYLNSQFKNMFFKIDIEGSEYRLLEDLIRFQNFTIGATIEFHDFDINLAKIADFIKCYHLQLCHIHANNFSPINNGTPLCVELSFTSTLSSEASSASYPIDIDFPNNSKEGDYIIEFQE